MPRYLGIDYLLEALTARRELLNRCLLTVPRHLEYVDKYSHSGSVSDSGYREPWKRGRPDETVLQEERSQLASDLKLLTDGFIHPEIEELSRDVEVGCRGVWEFVPSSNPDSQDSFPGEFTYLDEPDDDDVPADLTENVFTEMFPPYDLPSEKSCESVLGHKDALEEVLTKEPLLEFWLNLPSLHKMLSCLKQHAVRDPLKDHGQGTNHGGMPHHDRQLELKDPVSREPELEMSEESFTKVNLKPQMELFEECIFPTEGKPHATADCISELRTSLQTVNVPDEPEILDVLKDLVGTVSGIDITTEAIELPLPLSQEKLTNFVDINGGTQYRDAEWDRQKLKFDPPLELPHEEHQALSSLLTGTMKGLTPLDHNEGENMCFLSPRSKDSLDQSYWRHEKYFREVLALLFKEPDIQRSPTFKGSLTREMTSLLSVDEVTIKEELHVPWNIQLEGRKSPDSVEDLEMLHSGVGIHLGPKETVENVTWEEKIEKYPAACLHDPTDPVLDDVTPVSQFDILRNAILERKRTDQIPSVPSCTMKSQHTSLQSKPAMGKFSQRRRKFSSQSEDPLNTFLMMRSTPDTSPNMPNTDSEQTSNSGKGSAPVKSVSTSSNPDKRSKVKLMTVPFTGQYAEAVQLLYEFSGTALGRLHQSGTLPQHQHLATLPPDMTRFLLKQMERQNADSEMQRNMLLVHITTCIYDVYLHCSLEGAIFCLSALEEKYQEQLRGCTFELHQKLFRLQHKNVASHCLHPKMKEMCLYIEDWLRRHKRMDRQSDTKILVIVKRDEESLLTQLCSILASCNQLQPMVLTKKEQDTNTLLNRLDQVNCVITSGRNIKESFPWSQFSLVVEYEHHPQAGWQAICQRQSISYLGLKVDSSRVKPGKGVNRLDSSHSVGKQLVLMASQKLTANTDLLQLLEKRFNTLVVERNYSKLMLGRSYLHFADIVVDEKTGICLFCLAEVSSNTQLEQLYNRMISLHQKFTLLCLIIYPDLMSERSFQQISPDKTPNINKLQNALSYFADSVEDFDIKVVVTKDLLEAAKVICTISQNVQALSGDDTDVVKLIKETSPEEIHLLTFPCFNSISAQKMLRTSRLKDLMVMKSDVLKSRFPSLPQKVIQKFVHLRSHTNGDVAFSHGSDEQTADTGSSGSHIRRSITEISSTKENASLVRSPDEPEEREVAMLMAHDGGESPARSAESIQIISSPSLTGGRSTSSVLTDSRHLSQGCLQTENKLKRTYSTTSSCFSEQTCLGGGTDDVADGYVDLTLSLSPTMKFNGEYSLGKPQGTSTQGSLLTDISSSLQKYRRLCRREQESQSSEENDSPKLNEFIRAEIEGQLEMKRYRGQVKTLGSSKFSVSNHEPKMKIPFSSMCELKEEEWNDIGKHNGEANRINAGTYYHNRNNMTRNKADPISSQIVSRFDTESQGLNGAIHRESGDLSVHFQATKIHSGFKHRSDEDSSANVYVKELLQSLQHSPSRSRGIKTGGTGKFDIKRAATDKSTPQSTGVRSGMMDKYSLSGHKQLYTEYSDPDMPGVQQPNHTTFRGSVTRNFQQGKTGLLKQISQPSDVLQSSYSALQVSYAGSNPAGTHTLQCASKISILNRRPRNNTFSYAENQDSGVSASTSSNNGNSSQQQEQLGNTSYAKVPRLSVHLPKQSGHHVENTFESGNQVIVDQQMHVLQQSNGTGPYSNSVGHQYSHKAGHSDRTTLSGPRCSNKEPGPLRSCRTMVPSRITSLSPSGRPCSRPVARPCVSPIPVSDSRWTQQTAPGYMPAVSTTGCHFPTRQHMRIGVAQPLARETMLQGAPAVSGDSPPMDLDSDDEFLWRTADSDGHTGTASHDTGDTQRNDRRTRTTQERVPSKTGVLRSNASNITSTTSNSGSVTGTNNGATKPGT